MVLWMCPRRGGLVPLRGPPLGRRPAAPIRGANWSHPLGYLTATVQGKAEPPPLPPPEPLQPVCRPRGPPRGPALAMALDRSDRRVGRQELPGAGLGWVPRCQGYPADNPVAPPHLMGLISGSLPRLKASRTLLEPAQRGAPLASHARAAPAEHPDGSRAP